MEQWAECPPPAISLMALAGIKPKRKDEQKAEVNPAMFQHAVSSLGMKEGKPFVPAREFDRLFEEFTRGRRHH